MLPSSFLIFSKDAEFAVFFAMLRKCAVGFSACRHSKLLISSNFSRISLSIIRLNDRSSLKIVPDFPHSLTLEHQFVF
jgi:hypothetical protein